MKPTSTVLDIFSEHTKRWFESSLGEPTAVQKEAWPSIAKGNHTLVSAPTGTGKTLSAFLVFIDRFKRQLRENEIKNELQLIYISPLKALATDIRENLYRPLNGISAEEERSGLDFCGITTAIRTGDTTAAERRRMIKTSPHILITTPESLYLLLTSKSGKEILKTAKAIIIDELHAMIDTKRGAHLMLSLARLDKLCEKPLQRIGLSATIKPLELAAEYLAGSDVVIAAPKMQKDFKIEVTSPAPNMHALSTGTIWNDIAQSVYDHCKDTRSVIAFVDGRMYSEKLAYYVNQIAGEGFARTHHGCVSKEQRFEAENDLRQGKLRLLCATSSMELGIDVGDIDRVLQIGYPRLISSVMQRLGRAGHNPGRVSVMHMFPRTVPESIYCGLTAHTATNGTIERSNPPRLCFDVLAQHLVSMAADDGYTVDEVMELLPLAYPFKNVTKEDVKSILTMLAGDFEHARDLPVRPRILYDRIHEKVDGDAYSRMLAVSAGGTIPDTGLFTVRSENNVKLGELDEEFVFEARVGDKFLLGSFAWKIIQMDKDTVRVVQSSVEGAQPPFWRHIWLSRKLQTGIAFGKLMNNLTVAASLQPFDMKIVLKNLGLDDFAADNAVGFLTRQIEATGVLPDDKTIIAEHFTDDAGDNQLIFHSVFGRQINAPLSILLNCSVSNAENRDVSCFEDDDGILLMSRNSKPFPKGLLQSIVPETAKEILEAALPSSSLFNMTFRYNAGRALMMGVSKGKRNPLWIQRLRSSEMLDSVIKFPDHPLIRETTRECLEDYWDLPGLEWVLNGIQAGAIQVREIFRNSPSPMSLPLRHAAESSLLYDYFPSTNNINEAAEDMLKDMQKIKPAAEQLARLSERGKTPEDEMQLHSLLMIEGDFVVGELEVPYEWFENLASAERVFYIEPGLWIAAEQAEEYSSALENQNSQAMQNIVRRALRYRGAHYAEQVAERYFLPLQTAKDTLNALKENKTAVEDDGLFYHADLYERARNATITSRRKQIKTVPPENYAALLSSKLSFSAPPLEQVKHALNSLHGQPFPVALWESVLLPSRVSSYRAENLDNFLINGEFFYDISCVENQYFLTFNLYDNIDWDADMSSVVESLDDDEKTVYESLLKRGASFDSVIFSLLSGKSPHDVLVSLMEKGLIHSDSFTPVRQWSERAKTKKMSARQRINSRVKTLTSGRWEITRPSKPLSREQYLEFAFDKVIVLSRETYKSLSLPFSWASALEMLRVWEFTGQVRRGYFVEGLSGAQFIREKDFSGAVFALENPSDEILWLSATDPLQSWGKYLSHLFERNFMCIAGTAVALKSGLPIAVFEKRGGTLRVFNYNLLSEAINSFVKVYSEKRIFYSFNKIVVKDYPECAAGALKNAGFVSSMSDFVLHRNYK